MQNVQSADSNSSKRRDAANRLQEAYSNDEKEQKRVTRNPPVRSPRRQRHRGGSPSNGESDPELVSSRPPALEYYRNDDNSTSDEDTDADEMADEEYHCSGDEEAPADRSNAEQSDFYDSEEEVGEQQQEGIECPLQQEEGSGGSSSSKSKRTASQLRPGNKHRSQKQLQQQGQGTSSGRHYGRKGRHAPQELDCSSEQWAADIQRLRESKLKHNKNEQLRRKDMKDAVYKLRNQLRRKTKKPSTISVLKAAKQEIDELTAIKVEEEKELERLRQKELFLKYQLEALVSDHKKRLSSGGGTSLMVSPIRAAGVVGPPPPFLPSLPTAAANNPLNPPSLHSRPGLPQFPHFPVVPPSALLPNSTASATSPTAIGRVGLIDCPQRAAAAHANIITPGLAPAISRLPLPQPPNLIPFTAATNLNPSTPHSVRGSSSSPPMAGTAISIFPAAAQAGSIIPGVTPLHLVPPRTTTQQMFTNFPSPLIMPYPTVGRHPSPTHVIGGLTATHHPGVGRLTMTPNFQLPFGYLHATLRSPPTAIGVAGFGNYSAAIPISQSNTQHVQLPSAESSTIHTNGHSRRTSAGADRNADNSASHHSSSGSKNGGHSAETYSPHTRSPSKAISNSSSVREVSAESKHISASLHDSLYTVAESRDGEEYRHQLRATKRQRSNDHYNDDGEDDGCSNSGTMKKKQKVFDRYIRNGVVSVANASKYLVPSAAPPLLKVIDLEADADTTTGKKWSEDEQQPCEQDRQQHLCTLPPPPALKNTKVISSVIKHMQPQREIVTSSTGTRAGYSENEDCSVLENCTYYRGGREHRYRMSNSLSSSDEGPDSPQQNFNSLGQSTYCYNKLIGRDSLYLQVASKNSTNAGLCHKTSQYKNFRKKTKSNLLRPNHNHHSIVLQSTT